MTGLGVCELGVIPVRFSDSETSEMVNQLLFGDLVTIFEEKGSWYYIESFDDKYKGWIDKQMITLIDDTEFTRLKDAEKKYVHKAFSIIERNVTDRLNVFLGSTIRGINNNEFTIGSSSYFINNDELRVIHTEKIQSLLSIAKEYLNTPYLWGGKTPAGIDCSGFVQVIFRMIGINLNRDASQQAEQGETVDFLEEATTGDLVFFDNDEGKITHVGIMLKNSKIIHASGFVRVDTIDHHGIYRENEKRYTHKLRLIKRIVP